MPIIFLSAVSDTDTKVEGITQFAEDYVTKPFEYSELLARVRRVLTRTTSHHDLDPEIEIDERI